MLGDIRKVEHIYIACGYTDLRRGIDGLAQIVQNQFSLDPCSNSLFLFCGRRRDRIKALLWEGDGFVLLYKRVETGYDAVLVQVNHTTCHKTTHPLQANMTGSHISDRKICFAKVI